MILYGLVKSKAHKFLDFICHTKVQRLLFFTEMTSTVFKNTYSSFFRYYKTVFVLLLAVSLPFSIFEQLLFKLASQSQDRIFFGSVGLISSFFELFLVQLVLAFGIKKQTHYHRGWLEHILYYIKPLVIETSRGYARTALWTLLFILPGLYKFVALSLITYVVQFNESYDKGESDALEMSEELARKNLFPFLVTTLLFLFLTVGIQFFGMKYVLFESPLEWFLYFIFDMTLVSFFYLFFYQYYKQLHESV